MLCVWMVYRGMPIDDRPLTPKDTIAELLATYPAAAPVLHAATDGGGSHPVAVGYSRDRS
jgi:hypothetical protein